MSKKFLFFLIFLFIVVNMINSSAIVINEILYDPSEQQGGYKNGEWIEIYNKEDFDVSLNDWIIKDKGSANTSLEGLLLANSYAIIADNVTNFNNTWNCSCLVIEGNLGLKDSGDEIWLWNQTSLVDYVNYSDIASEGSSLQLCNELFIPNNPTPEQENNCSQQSQHEKEIELGYDSEVECDEEFSIELEAFNFEDGDYDVKIDILDEDENRIGKVWDENEEKWSSTNHYVLSILEIEDSEGIVILEFKVEDFEGEAILRPRIRETGSSSYEQFDDYSIDVECDIQKESEIKILEAPKQAKFGDNIQVDIEIYRGDTAKYAVYIYVQDMEEKEVSDKVSLHCDEKFETYYETIELLLDCKTKQGVYEIIAEGLNTEDREDIELKACDLTEEKENTGSVPESSSSEFSNLEEKQNRENNIYSSYSIGSVIESKSFFLNKTMPYILISVALLLVIYLVIKKI